MPTPLTTPLLSTTNAAANGVRLDEWLAARFAYFDAAGWAREIDAGRVHRNGAVAHAAERLGTGDTIAFFPAADENAAADIPILFADADLVVVAKPPHRVVQRASSIAGAAFLPALTTRFPSADLGVLEPAHRLDRETSGVLVLARSRHAARALHQQFANGEVTKRYVAVVVGAFAGDSRTLDAPIGPAAGSAIAIRRAVVAAHDPDAQPALTLVTVEKRLAHHTVVALAPQTGRTHQLRVHLAHAGHPIVGDKLYGRSDAEYLAWVAARKAGQRPGDAADGPRLLLHAHELRCRHPRGGEELAFTVPWPADFAAFVTAAASV